MQASPISGRGEPIVGVATPVYNGERYLAECIESVIRQTYTDWEYVIVDNRSTDRSADIAEQYAAQDARIRVVRASQYVDVYTNHNRALSELNPRTHYHKIIHADDWMTPNCLERMVAVADAQPTVGLVSSLRSVSGEVEYRVPVAPGQTVRPGREAVRSEFLGLGWASGSPSTLLFRADLVRACPVFFDPTVWHGDTDTFFRVLMSSDLGFVHEVLTFTRLHPEAQSAFTVRVGSMVSRDARLLLRYGRATLSPAEYRRRRNRFLARYAYFLTTQLLRPSRRGDLEFYEFHRRDIDYAIAEAGAEPAMRRLLWLYRRLLIDPVYPSAQPR